MLNLFDSIAIPGVPHVQVFHDDQDDRLFYMLPEFPSISKGPDGGPMFSLLVFSRDFHLMKDATQTLGPTETEGALLAMQTELSVSDGDQAKIVGYLTNQHQGYRPVFAGPGQFRFAAFRPDPRPVKLSYPIWVDGKVQFLLIPSAGPTFVKATGGSEKPSLIAANLANYSALLGQEGENLVRTQVEKGQTPGSVNYTISFMARIPSLTIDVTGNMSDVYKEIKQYCQVYEREGSRYYTYPQVSSLQEIRTKFASLHIVVKSVAWPSDADAKMVEDVENKLNELAFNVIQTYIQNQLFSTAFTAGVQADRLGSTFDHTRDTPVPGNQLWLKDFSQSVSGTIDFHVSYEKNIPITKNPNGLLLEILSPDEIKKRITTADLTHPYFNILEVPVRVTADFEKDPIAAIKVFVDYNQRDEVTGDQRAATEEFTFTTGKEVFYFRALMAKDQSGAPKDSYAYSSEIVYKASSQPEKIAPQVTRDRSLVLGYTALNCVRVQVQWGAIPTDTIQRVQVHLRYPGLNSPTAQADIFLTPERSSDVWFTYTGNATSSQYEYRLSYFLASGERLDLPAQTSNQQTLIVNAPFEDALRVTFVPQGTFPPTSSIVVSARYADADSGYHVEDVHTFTDLKSNWAWQVRLHDQKKRAFEYRVIVTYADGSSYQGDWTPGQEGTILVGDVARVMLGIEVVPTLLDLQRTWKLVIVHLKYEDPANHLAQEQTFQITAANAGQGFKWSVPIKDPAKKKYTYEVQAFGYDTSKVNMIAATESTGPLVVLNF